MMKMLLTAAALAFAFVAQPAFSRSPDTCQEKGGTILNAAYCGNYSLPPPPPPASTCTVGASSYPGCAGAQSCQYYVAPSGGSDTNAGTAAAPFATLAHMQTALQGTLVKVGCLKAGSGGTYNLSSGLTFTSADNGEVWQFDPASGTRTAILSGGNSVIPVTINGTNGLTINGLKMTACYGQCIVADNSILGNNVTIENSEFGNNFNSGSPGGFPFLIFIDDVSNLTFTQNYVHDCLSGCVSVSAYSAGSTYNGAKITSNFVENCATSVVDGGCIQMGAHQNYNTAGSGQILNNFVRNYGVVGGSGNGERGIYLDDDTSNITVTGNIVGPMTVGETSGDSSDIIINGGTNNVFTNNIFDIGTSLIEGYNFEDICGQGGTISCSGPVGPNTFNKNIIVMNFSGTWNGNVLAGGGPWAEYSTVTSAWLSISGNMYHNYGSGSTLTTGPYISDSNTTIQDPLCSGYLYTLASNSPAFGTFGFADVTAARNAGPLGGSSIFVIPTSTNKSCPG
jgi:hypothetical protein